MRKAIGLGLVVAGGVAVFTLTRGSASTPEQKSAGDGAIAPGLPAVRAVRDLGSGAEHRYTVALVHASRPSEGEPFSLAVDGEWALAVVAGDPGVTTVRAELRNAKIKIGQTVSPAPRLATPYTFTLGTDGRLLALQFPRDLANESRVLLTALAATAQITEGGRAPTWTAIETDSLGHYEARYRREGAALRKSKLAYRKTTGDEPLAVRVVESATDISLRDDGWASEIDQREELVVGFDKISVTVAGRISLRHAGVTRGVVASRPDGLETVAVDATSSANRDEADRELLDGASFVDLLGVLASVRDNGNASAHTYLRLVALFRLDPEAARVAGRTVVEGKLDARDAGAVIGALGEAGTVEAQRALVTVVETPTVGNDQRLHGALSLGMTATPQPETLATLATASHAADPDLSSTATLALGNAALRLQGSDATAAARQVDELLARLREATDDAMRMIFLRALGNTGDVRILPALEAALASNSDVVRGAAAESLRLIPDIRADVLLIASLDDLSTVVRTSAVFAATHRPLEPLVHPLAVRARIDEDVSVRRAILELAGTRMTEHPGLRAIVTHAAKHDTDPEIRTAAQKFLI